MVNNIKEAKYYSMLFDSTPDISHTDQMTQIIRYIVIQEGTVQILESFIDFIPLKGKTSEDITKMILQKLDNDGININDCRGQGYDNAASMAGIHRGVQQRIKNVNEKAEFIACTNHSLNLAGVHAAGETVNSITFFGTLERVYTFFSSSTHRWDVLKSHVPTKVKRIIETRWSARYDAVNAIRSHFAEVFESLEKLTGAEENADTRSSAGIMMHSITTFPFLCYLGLWGKILPEVNDVQKYLQTKGLGLDRAVDKIQVLQKFLDDERYWLVMKGSFTLPLCVRKWRSQLRDVSGRENEWTATYPKY